MNFRERAFGSQEHLPLFLKENGNVFWKTEFKKDLGELLAIYPELSTERDSWSGHSFRSGISTLLSVLGFSELEIKKWGRWSSDAYISYIKDLAHRKLVHARMKTTFRQMLENV